MLHGLLHSALGGVALARGRSLARGGRAFGLWPAGRGAPAFFAALASRRFVDDAAAARATLGAAAIHLVDGGPGAPFGLALRHAALLVTLLDVARLSLLFLAVLCFRSAWH